MSPLRTTTLLAAAVLTALAALALVDVADGGDQKITDTLVLTLTCASLATWLAYVAVSVRDSICGKLDDFRAELAGQLAAVAEMVGEYGDQREAAGYLGHARDSMTTNGQIHRVK